MNDDLAFMRRALELAEATARDGNLPFGAVLVRAGTVVCEAANTVTTSGDPTAHAEIDAIRKACRELGTPRLDGLQLYTNGEPCPMCLTAVYWSGISELIFGSSRDDATDAGLPTASLYAQVAEPWDQRTLPTRRLAEQEARELLLRLR